MNEFRKLGFTDYNGHLEIHSSPARRSLEQSSFKKRDLSKFEQTGPPLRNSLNSFQSWGGF
jgi:hypothetical protein